MRKSERRKVLSHKAQLNVQAESTKVKVQNPVNVKASEVSCVCVS